MVDAALVAVAHPLAPGALLVAAIAEPSLDLATEASQRGGRDDALGCATDAHDGMDARAGDGGGDRGREVTVADELDPGAGLPDLGDQLVVAWPFEDDDRDVLDPPAERLGDAPQVFARALADVHLARHARSDAQLLHVGVRRMGQAAGLRGGEHSDRPGLSVRHEVGALQRVDRDIDPGRLGVTVGAADLLADVEHRGLVALALADDDPSGEVDLLHRRAHRLGGESVGAHAVAATHGACGGDGRLLGDADHLECEQLFHVGDPPDARVAQWRK